MTYVNPVGDPRAVHYQKGGEEKTRHQEMQHTQHHDEGARAAVVVPRVVGVAVKRKLRVARTGRRELHAAAAAAAGGGSCEAEIALLQGKRITRRWP